MARPLRVEYEGACYHVMNRGNQRGTVFHTDAQHELFLERLGHFALQFGVRVHAFCLMPNHFHALLTTREANLSRFMQGFLTSFSASLNRVRRVSGHVFQGRFKGELVEAQRYLSEASRYIHLNALRTQACRALGIEQRRERLHQFPWSSFRVLIGVDKRPEWMDTGPVLATWGASPDEQMKNYRLYVEQGLTENLPNPFLNVREQSILGSDSFVDTIRRKYLLLREIKDRREELALRHLRHSFSLDDVLQAVGRVYKTDATSLLRRRSGQREPRRVAMYTAAVYCRHSCTLAEIASRFGVGTSGLCAARDRVAQAIEHRNGRALSERLATVVSELQARRKWPE